MGSLKTVVVLAGVEYEANLGMVARAMKNFGVSALRIVEPACMSGPDAVKYSKHAKDVLSKAVRYPSLGEAVGDCEAAVGFSGILKRHKTSIRAAIGLKEFSNKAAGYSGRVALVFGREGIGLTRGELAECDYLVHIESDKGYPVLNLSHAVAVALYALRARKKAGTMAEKRLPARENRALIDMFKRLAGRYRIRNQERCEVAFRRVVGRANPTEKEGRSIMNALRLVLEELEGRGK